MTEGWLYQHIESGLDVAGNAMKTAAETKNQDVLLAIYHQNRAIVAMLGIIAAMGKKGG